MVQSAVETEVAGTWEEITPSFYHVLCPLSILSARSIGPLSHFYKCLILYIFLSAFCVRAPAARLITTSPALTELVFQLGKGGEIVAATDYSDYPEAAKNLPRIGGLFSPSIEKLLSYQPDWVILDAFTLNPQFKTALEALHIKTLTVKVDSVAALYKESEKILKTIYGASLDQKLRNLKIKRGKTFSYLAFTWSNPPILIGSHTFLSDLFSISGGRNILGKEILTPYPQVSEEWLLKQSPDVVYYLEDSPQAGLMFKEQIAKWWPGLHPKITSLDPTLFARTSFTPLEHL